MFIQVVHEVLDVPGWNNLAKQFQDQGGPPPHLTLHTSVTTKDRSNVFCLWEADSVEAVSSFLDPMTEGVLRNTYYSIDTSVPATSLPHAVAAP